MRKLISMRLKACLLFHLYAFFCFVLVNRKFISIFCCLAFYEVIFKRDKIRATAWRGLYCQWTIIQHGSTTYVADVIETEESQNCEPPWTKKTTVYRRRKRFWASDCDGTRTNNPKYHVLLEVKIAPMGQFTSDSMHLVALQMICRYSTMHHHKPQKNILNREEYLLLKSHSLLISTLILEGATE